MKKAKIAIIIVNWNGLRFLKDCLGSVYNQTYQNFDVYFVDNNSSDDSVVFVEDNFPKTKIIKLDRNTGFAEGNNIAIFEAFNDKEVEYIVCLNNDTIVYEGWLEALAREVDYENKIEMISSLSLFVEGEVQTIGLRLEKDLMGDKLGGLSIGYKQDISNFLEKREVFCPSGVSVLYTRNLLNEVGLFDPDFFAYAEDLDLGIRARKKGFKCIFTPNSKLIHLHSQSSGGEASPMKAFLIKRNNYFVAIKNFSFVDLVLFPLRDIAWSIRNLLNKTNSVKSLKNKIGMFGMAKIMLKVYFDVIIMSPKMFIKRFKNKKY